tara:strand:+ start:116 stop:1012 length:897 start_codon:yes stop_codon:yes gene_type:complete
MFTNKTSLIIPTKERIDYLKRFFSSLGDLVYSFDEILIIDSSSDITHKKIINNFLNYNNIKVIKCEPSTSLQRNVGIKSYKKTNKFLMFCDDDIIFEKGSILSMNNFIISNPNNVGYGFNLIENEKKDFFEKIKKNNFFQKNGYYSQDPGIVCENGWHSKICNIQKDTNTMWLSTQACIYKADIIKNKLFDIKLGKYSYLEDLFISHELSKKGKLIICAESRYKHPDFIERKDFNFGVQEVVNRYKFVKKFKLNISKFYITIFLKSSLTFFKIIIGRLSFVSKFLGNLYGIFLCILRK